MADGKGKLVIQIMGGVWIACGIGGIMAGIIGSIVGLILVALGIWFLVMAAWLWRGGWQ